MSQDVSPFDPRAPRRRRRRNQGVLGGAAALLAVLGLAVATWSLGNVDRVIPPTNPTPSSTAPASDGDGG